MLIDKRDSETKRCKEILLCNLKKKVNWGDFATELDCFPLFTAWHSLEVWVCSLMNVTTNMIWSWCNCSLSKNSFFSVLQECWEKSSDLLLTLFHLVGLFIVLFTPVRVSLVDKLFVSSCLILMFLSVYFR